MVLQSGSHWMQVRHQCRTPSTWSCSLGATGCRSGTKCFQCAIIVVFNERAHFVPERLLVMMCTIIVICGHTFSVCLFCLLSCFLSCFLSNFFFIYLSILSVCLSIHVSIFLSIDLSIYVCLSISLYVCLSVYLSVELIMH